MTSPSYFKPGGWYVLADHLVSPNVDERPAGYMPELLVIHNISLPPGQFSSKPYIADLFLNRLDTKAHPDFESLQGVRVSAHFLIRRDGSLIQFAGADQRAWHAGTSEFRGRERCNDFSVGIEMEGSDFVPFEPAQYVSLTKVAGALLQHYPIRHIVGHEDIAPGRKTDPGPLFDWTLFENGLRRDFPDIFADSEIRFRSGS